MINKPVKVIKAIKNVKLQSAIYIILFMIIVKYYGTIRDRGNTDDYFGYIAIMLIIQLVTFIYHLFYDVRRIEIYDNGEIKLIMSLRKIELNSENDFFRLIGKDESRESFTKLHVYKNKMQKFQLACDRFSKEDQQYIREHFPIKLWSGKIRY